ncbi:hypothetical protein EKO04_003476 [Ascochyta lentis]|uniref:Zn(2)-C6 fungal-type domain-containing protein n=1 Tax=Ascochyta lentis TaxID=205686 RepID=A0A8H7J9R8_9PLEO|nr:hypothetical protein EKO04_003476 [Ascochyta lentis]
MADDALPDQPGVTFDFNLPHGTDVEEDTQETPVQSRAAHSTWSFDHLEDDHDPTADLQGNSSHPNHIVTSSQDNNEEVLNYRQFSPGFSDDDGGREAFERSWHSHQAEKQATKAAKGKKSPRRSNDDVGESESSAPAKTPRQSLFSGPKENVREEGEVGSLLTPAASGDGFDNRMSSLSLDQQMGDDSGINRSISTGFGLACSDIGSVRDSPVPSDEEFDIPPDDVVPYELRQNIDRKKAFTYIDTDKSGNWDPEQEAKERAVKQVRARAANREKKEGREKKSKPSRPKEYTMKCIVKLPFEAFGNVRNATNDEQHWPEDWSEIDSGQERELEEYREAYRINTPDRRLQLPLEDPAAEVDDLTGHPAARGCKECRKLAQNCSMIKGGEYPCMECIEDGNECHPIQKPTVKGRCKQCHHAEADSCSLEHDPTQLICDHCADNDFICKALPPHGYKAQRVDLDRIAYGPDRPYAACTACRLHKRRCSLKGKKDKPPCKYCKKNNLGCNFTELPKHDAEEQSLRDKSLLERIAPEVANPESKIFTPEDIATMRQRNDVVLSREPTPEIEMTDAEGNKGMLTKITTSFSHPIRFDVKDSAGSECNFCGLPLFGMVGYYEREVHVIRWNSGLGYSEVGGGHCQNEGETIMCTECTGRRLQIIACPGHNFEPMADAGMDYGTLTDEIVEAETGGADMQYQLQRWCSMCFFPAAFGCNTVQPTVQGLDGEEIEGCNLRVCATCEEKLRVGYEGDFDQMATEMEKLPKISEADEILGATIEGRPRADVGFLTQDGMLLRSVEL